MFFCDVKRAKVFCQSMYKTIFKSYHNSASHMNNAPYQEDMEKMDCIHD